MVTEQNQTERLENGIKAMNDFCKYADQTGLRRDLFKPANLKDCDETETKRRLILALENNDPLYDMLCVLQKYETFNSDETESLCEMLIRKWQENSINFEEKYKVLLRSHHDILHTMTLFQKRDFSQTWKSVGDPDHRNGKVHHFFRELSQLSQQMDRLLEAEMYESDRKNFSKIILLFVLDYYVSGIFATENKPVIYSLLREHFKIPLASANYDNEKSDSDSDSENDKAKLKIHHLSQDERIEKALKLHLESKSNMSALEIIQRLDLTDSHRFTDDRETDDRETFDLLIGNFKNTLVSETQKQAQNFQSVFQRAIKEDPLWEKLDNYDNLRHIVLNSFNAKNKTVNQNFFSMFLIETAFQKHRN